MTLTDYKVGLGVSCLNEEVELVLNDSAPILFQFDIDLEWEQQLVPFKDTFKNIIKKERRKLTFQNLSIISKIVNKDKKSKKMFTKNILSICLRYS